MATAAREIRAHYLPDDIPAAAERLWRPWPAQARFLARREFEALYGGSAGPGKTDALIFGALRQVAHPRYHAGVFRRTYRRLQELMDRAHRVFPRLGGVWNEQRKRWRFPSGAFYSFNHCEDENSKYGYLTVEFTHLAFDQLEEFTESVYTFLLMRCRTSAQGLNVRVRASANPGGTGHAWVMKRWAIDRHPQGFVSFVDPASGLSRVYVPARVWDNPSILRNDPGYVQRLMAIPDPALRRAYLEGDWSVFAGQYFSEFTRAAHVLELGSRLRRRPPSWHEVAGGLDYGQGAAPTVLELAAFDDRGRGRLYKELVLEGLNTADDIASGILGKLETPQEQNATIYTDTQMWIKNPETGVGVAEDVNNRLVDAGVGAQLLKANKDRINGWARCHGFLDPRRPLPEGGCGPWLLLLEGGDDGLGCPYLIETLPTQIHDPNHPSDLLKSSTDHACDAARYLLISRVPLPEIPLELRPRATHAQRIGEYTRKAVLRALQLHARDQAAAQIGDEGIPEEGVLALDDAEVADVWT